MKTFILIKSESEHSMYFFLFTNICWYRKQRNSKFSALWKVHKIWWFTQIFDISRPKNNKNIAKIINCVLLSGRIHSHCFAFFQKSLGSIPKQLSLSCSSGQNTTQHSTRVHSFRLYVKEKGSLFNFFANRIGCVCWCCPAQKEGGKNRRDRAEQGWMTMTLSQDTHHHFPLPKIVYIMFKKFHPLNKLQASFL